MLFGIFSKLGSKHIGNIKYEPIDLVKKTADMGILIGDVNWMRQSCWPGSNIRIYQMAKGAIGGIEYITLGVPPENDPLKAYQKIGFIHDISFESLIMLIV